MPRAAAPREASALERALAQAAHLLPAQAPLEVFVHHNTLHAYQHLPFYDAIAAARARTGASGTLPLKEYRAALETGRVRLDDLDDAIAACPLALSAEPSDGLPPGRTLARAALLHDVRACSAAKLEWEIAEHEADHRFAAGVPEIERTRVAEETARWLRARPGWRGLAVDLDRRREEACVRALWTTCQELSRGLPPLLGRDVPEPRFLRDLFVSRGEPDPDQLVDSALVPACASFLDRGQSHWTMPDRDLGFFPAWSRMQTSGKAVRPAWLADLGKRLRRWSEERLRPVDVAQRLIEEMGITADELEPFVTRTLMQLPGWAGMFSKLETAPGPIGRSRAKVRLIDFFAVRLVLHAQACRDVGRRGGYRGPLAGLRAHLRAKPPLGRSSAEAGPEATAWPLFLLAQHAGVSAAALSRSGRRGAAAMLDVLRRLDDPMRLAIWHEAYERRYRDALLEALDAKPPVRADLSKKRFQIVCCLDDREESLRRHFEELSAEHETFGAAGFFNLAIAYKGVDDPSTFPLCPVVVEPRHRIEERATAEHLHLAEARRRWRKRLGWLETRFDRASRSMLWGPLVTALAGAVTAVPLLVRVFAPRFGARLRRAATRRLLPELRTELTVPRTGGDEGAGGARALLAGFTVEEKATRVAALLESMGMTRRFAPIVALIGHDSSSVNNFHFAAYSCGACGGRSGGPNARLFARMANRPEVRALLRERGIDIPRDTVFVGGVHDTCADTIRFYDVERIPEALAPRLEELHRQLDRALAKNAHERCRRFESAPRASSVERAKEHVEGRAVDLSQPRPELGHATNAGCVVGRRAMTEGLFLDRRVFLVSYDPDVDATGEILERLLLAVAPVCAGINLEYFFSYTDNERYGAGTKLPHNVTALVGVMNGTCSDLRTGLPRQMIEAHEPMRLSLVVETDVATMTAILERQPSLAELFGNEWMRLSLRDPRSGATSVFEPARGFTPWTSSGRALAIAKSSADWYRGEAGFVRPAMIEPTRQSVREPIREPVREPVREPIRESAREAPGSATGGGRAR